MIVAWFLEHGQDVPSFIESQIRLLWPTAGALVLPLRRAEVARPGPGGPNVDDSEWIIILGGSTVEGLAEAASRVQGQAKGSGLFRLEHATWSIS